MNEAPVTAEIALQQAQDAYTAISVALSYAAPEDREWLAKTLEIQESVCHRMQVAKKRSKT